MRMIPRPGYEVRVRLWHFAPIITLVSPAGRVVRIRVYERQGPKGEPLGTRHFEVRSGTTAKRAMRATPRYWGPDSLQALIRAEHEWGMHIKPFTYFGDDVGALFKPSKEAST
jgi:hypothetical protein